MMDSFSDYLSRVKAEDELKDSTKAYVKAALAGAADENMNSGSVINIRKERPAVKKLLVAVSSVAACAVLTIGGYAYYNTPVNYVSVDINPSVEFGVNAFNRVVCAEAYNEDGTLLLRENEYLHLSLEAAVCSLVQEATEQGYIMEDGSTVVAVTAESNNHEKALKLQTLCENGVSSALDAEESSAVVYTDCIELQLRTQAREAGVSPGKFRLIEMLQTLDPDATVEQYRNTRITDIISEANELMLRNGYGGTQNEEYAGSLERIRNTARLVQAACDAEQEQNRNGEQYQNSGDGTQQQNQNQAQNQNQSSAGSEQEQEQNANGAQSQNSGSVTQQQAQNQGSDGAQQEQEQNENGAQSQNSPDAAQQVQDQGQSGGAADAGQEQAQGENQAGSQTETGGTEQGAADAGQNGSGTGSGDSGAPAQSGADSSGSQSGSGSGGKN